MKTRKVIFVMILLFCIVFAFADWNESNPADMAKVKMHYPQLPNPTGWDIKLDGVMLADDWNCTETGYVDDIHFWGSWLNDDNRTLTNISVKIYNNIPAGIENPSYPGLLLWSRVFLPGEFNVVEVPGGLQGFITNTYSLSFYYPNNHNRMFQINIKNISNPFWQEQGNIYWLAINVKREGDETVSFGWKTSISPQFMDAATINNEGWYPMYDLNNSNAPIDLAFVITSECEKIKGNGSLSDPWNISQCCQLQKIGTSPYDMNDYYQLVKNIDCSNTSVSGHALNNGGLGFKPIGNDTNRFNGTFDGRGLNIINLYINRSGENYVGLFGYSQGIVNNVGLINANVTGVSFVGALMGIGEGVNNSFATCDVTGTGSFIGGLMGENKGSVINSYAKCNVTGNSQVGGLIGISYGNVTNSYSISYVKAVSSVGGGLVGHNGGSINNSYAAGKTIGITNSGGLIGNNVGTIINSYWDICRTNQTNCTGNIGTPSGCTGKNHKISNEDDYFFNDSNEPMLIWDSSWDDVCNNLGYQKLAWQNAAVSDCFMAPECSFGCGSLIISSLDFENDIQCNGTAFVVNTSNLLINCNNYSITGNGTGEGIYLKVINNVTVVNCNISNFTMAIRLSSSDNNNLTSNYLHNNNDGLALYNAGGNTGNIIFNNLIYNNSHAGIYLFIQSNNNKIESNEIFHNVKGIFFENPFNNTSNNNKLESNNIFNNNEGVLIDPSYNNTIISNSIFNNSIYGILLQDSNNNTIINNSIYNNTDFGIGLNASDKNLIANNTIFNNNVEFIVAENSTDNNVTLNNISMSILVNLSQSLNLSAELNYWNTTNISLIASEIFDAFDNSTVYHGIVDFCPLANSSFSPYPSSSDTYVIGSTFNGTTYWGCCDDKSDCINSSGDCVDTNTLVLPFICTNGQWQEIGGGCPLDLVNITSPNASQMVQDDVNITFVYDNSKFPVFNAHFAVDGGEWFDCNSNTSCLWNTSLWEDGEHVIQVSDPDQTCANSRLMLVVVNNLGIDNTAPIGSILINNNSNETTSRNVLLNLNYSDTYLKDCRYVNDDVTNTWTNWETCVTERAWTLSTGSGLKTVFYQIRDFNGNNITLNDTIDLEGNPPSTPVINSSHVNGSWSNINNVFFNWTSNDTESSILGYSFVLDNNDNTNPSTALSTATNITYTSLPDGDYWFHVKSFDQAENPSAVAHYNVKLSTGLGADIVLFAVPSPTGMFNVSGFVNNNLGNVTVKLYSNGTLIPATPTNTTDGSFKFTSIKFDNDGIYALWANATDNASNEYKSNVLTIVYDTTGPLCDYVYPGGSIGDGSVPYLFVITNEKAYCEYDDGSGYKIFQVTNNTKFHQTFISGDDSYDITCYDLAENSNECATGSDFQPGCSVSLGPLSPPSSVRPGSNVNVTISAGCAALHPSRFKLYLDDIEYDVSARDKGSNNYQIQFTAPEIEGKYDMILLVNNQSATATLNVEGPKLSITYTGLDKISNHIVSLNQNNYTIGIASDSTNTTIVTDGLEANPADGSMFIFITDPDANVANRENDLQRKQFLDYQTPSFGYSVKEGSYNVEANVFYDDIQISGDPVLYDGTYTVVIKNKGINETTGKVMLEIKVLG
jgi:parallel beta-helix repeat protein